MWICLQEREVLWVGWYSRGPMPKGQDNRAVVTRTGHWEKQSDDAGITYLRLPPHLPHSSHFSLFPQTHCSHPSRNKHWPLKGYLPRSLPNLSTPQPVSRTSSSSSFSKGETGPRTNIMRSPLLYLYFPFSLHLTATEWHWFDSCLGHSTGRANCLVTTAHRWWWRLWTKTLTYLKVDTNFYVPGTMRSSKLISERSCYNSIR